MGEKINNSSQNEEPMPDYHTEEAEAERKNREFEREGRPQEDYDRELEEAKDKKRKEELDKKVVKVVDEALERLVKKHPELIKNKKDKE